MLDTPHVMISSSPLSLDELLAVAGGSPVELSVEVLDVMKRSRAVVDAAIARGEAIYGVTTGVGHARDEMLPLEALEALQPILVEMHLGALGERLSTEMVRAGMVARLNGFARGGTGISLPVARSLEAMLNSRLHPIIPRMGSLGAGDLGQLAFLGRTLLGRGEVEWDGRVVGAIEALEGAGIPVVSFRPKDALGVISSNAITIGHGILLWRDIRRLLALADLVAATSMEAIGANPSVFEPVVSRVRGSAGQVETADILRSAVAESSRIDAATASVQDPLSFRVVPQVHGACRDVLATTSTLLADELNARSDNPLVDVEAERILSNGNFHAMGVALAAEQLRVALCHVGLLSERRMGHLWDAVVSSFGAGSPGQGGPPLDGGAPPPLAGLALRYPAAARYTRLRQLAQPVTLDVPPLDLSVEDHATNASEALWVTREAVEVIWEILTIEALIAFARLSMTSPDGRLGDGTGKLVDVIESEVHRLPSETLPHVTHERVSDALRRYSEGLPSGV